MSNLGPLLPRISGPVPGPASLELAERLGRVESRNVTALSRDFPVFWEEARGANVRDADGNVFLDFTAAFGVALLGHGAPAVREAIHRQADRLIHGMGDVHPPATKLRLLEALARIAPWSESRAVLTSSGSEAVEVALKTAHLATGRPGVIAFEGGYHGLTLGALSATARPYFRAPFGDRVPGGVAWAPFPTDPHEVEPVLATVEGWLHGGLPDGTPVGAVVVEPVQARGGVRVPAAGFGTALGARVRGAGALLVADEVYTGMGRLGAVWGSERVGLEPDVICAGKVLGGGMPLSACLAPRPVMDAWPESPGEALHTSTFLGHPLSCAAGLAVLEAVEGDLPGRAEAVGARLRARVKEGLAARFDAPPELRGLGLLLGVVLGPGQGVEVAVAALRRGLLVLPAGDEGEVVELSPPVTLTPDQVNAGVEILVEAVAEVRGG